MKLNSPAASVAQFTAVASLVEAWERQGSLTNSARLARFGNVFDFARSAMEDPASAEPLQMAALRLLGRPGSGPAPIQSFVRLLEPNRSTPLQHAALQALQRTQGAESGEGVLRQWPRMSPTLQAAATEMMLVRPVWVAQLLSAVETGTVSPRELGPGVRQRLMQHPTPTVRTRATKLFAEVSTDRRWCSTSSRRPGSSPAIPSAATRCLSPTASPVTGWAARVTTWAPTSGRSPTARSTPCSSP